MTSIKLLHIQLWNFYRPYETVSHAELNLTSLKDGYIKWKIWKGKLLDNPTAAAAKSLQLCLTLRDPIDGSPPGSPVPGILQARTLEWVAISFSNAWKWKVKVKSLSRVRHLATPWTATYQAPPSMGFSRQEYWSEVPLPSPDNPTTLILKCVFACTYVFNNKISMKTYNFF